jgi:sec-independent protein translocase protein TatB
MFDVGFWEMAFIGVIALVVIGPERLPKFARTAGLWMGKGRRMINDVKSDIKKEMNEDDLKTFKDLKSEVTSATDNVKSMADSASESFGIKEAAADLKSTIDAAKSDVNKEVETLDSSGLVDSSASSGSKASKKSAGKKAAKKKTKKKASTKTTATKTAGKKTVAKKTTPKKTATKKTASKKSASETSASKKTTAIKSETLTTVEAETLKD